MQIRLLIVTHCSCSLDAGLDLPHQSPSWPPFNGGLSLFRKPPVKGSPTARHGQSHYLFFYLQPTFAAAAAKSLQSCLTLRPHRWQPTRLPLPWDSPGKNTGVGCHFLLQCMKKVKSENEVVHRVRPSATPWTAAYQAPPSMGFARQEYRSGVPLPSLNTIYSTVYNHSCVC